MDGINQEEEFILKVRKADIWSEKLNTVLQLCFTYIGDMCSLGSYDKVIK